MRTRTALVVLAACVGVPGQGMAQPSERGGPPGGPGGALFDPLGVREAFSGPVVRGAPYKAQVVTEVTQTLADGNRIVRRSTGAVYRDSEGRTRRENSLVAIGALLPEEPPRMVIVHDPVAGERFVLDEERRVARRLPERPRHEGAERGRRADGDDPRGAWRPRGGWAAAAREPASEALGTRVIQGLDAEGTRTSITIPAGELGNEKPLEILSERWESPELHVLLLSTHKDPRFGETTYRLTGISRTEPDRSLFEIPAGYSVTSEPQRPGRFEPGREKPTGAGR